MDSSYQVLSARAHNMAEQIAELAKQLTPSGQTTTGIALAAGKLYEFTNEFDKALGEYEQALNVDSSNHEARLRTALVHLKSGNLQEGLRVALSAAEIKEDFFFKSLGGADTSTLTVVADAIFHASGLDAAKQAFEDALKLLPSDGYSAGRLAQWHLSQGDIPSAASLLNQIDTITHSRFDGVVAAITLAKVPNNRGLLQMRLTAGMSHAR